MESNKIYVVMETATETNTTDIDYLDSNAVLYGLYYKREDALTAVRERINEFLDKPYYMHGTQASDKRVEILCEGDTTILEAAANEYEIRIEYDIDSREIK